MRLVILTSVSITFISGCANLGILSKYNPEPTQVSVQDFTFEQSSWEELTSIELPTTDWIGSFNDLTLTRLVNEALEANTNIKASAARLDAAWAQFRIARAERLPTIDTNSRITRTETSLPFVTPTNLSSGVSANWEVDLWGRIKSTTTSNELAADAIQADYAGARLSIAGQVTLRWFDLIEARLLSELSARDVNTLEQALQLTQRRFDGGVSGLSDVSLAKSSFANAQALQAIREQTLSELTRSLEILLRRYPAEEIQAAEDLPTLPPLLGAGTPENVLRKRPDLLAAEKRLYAQGLQVDVARKNLLPRLSFTANGSISSTTFADFLDIESLAITMISNFSAPLYQGGRLRANIKQQEANLKEQLETYAGIALNAFLEVENALDAEQRLLNQETALTVSLNEAKNAEKRIEIRYKEGLATILQFLDAQSRRISAEGQLISARKERLSNRVRLHLALGGGFETGVEVSSNDVGSLSALSGGGIP